MNETEWARTPHRRKRSATPSPAFWISVGAVILVGTIVHITARAIGGGL